MKDQKLIWIAATTLGLALFIGGCGEKKGEDQAPQTSSATPPAVPMRWISDSKRFCAELMVLPQAAFLRALVAEVGGDVIDLDARSFLGD